MKVLLVVGLIVLLLAALYRVLRPAIRMAIQFFRAVRHFQQISNEPQHANQAGEKLIQCSTCETWIPESRALTAQSSHYCSRECVKRAGAARRRGNTAA